MSNDPLEPHSRELESRSRELFDAQVANHDARTRSRLNQARHAALAAARGNSRGNQGRELQRWLVPVGSAAALALMTVVAVQRYGVDPAQTSVAQVKVSDSVDDLEIMMSGTELDMLKDMDFYAWLDTQALDETSGAGATSGSNGAG